MLGQSGGSLGSAAVESIELAKPRASINGLVGLLAVAIFINYVDRGNLATAAPLIKDELKLSNVDFGYLVSAFFWTYATAQIPIGWILQRVPAHIVMAGALTLWAIATALSGIVQGFTLLLMLRLLLGLGESAAFPCMSKMLADNLPPERLGAANGLVSAGIAIGPAFGTLAGGLIMARFGWRASFLLFGLIPLLWLWPWLSVTRSLHARSRKATGGSPPTYLAILAKRAAWGTTLGHFAGNYTLYFVLSWLPLYLVKSHGFSLVEMAKLGALVYLVNGLSCILSGHLADRWIATGVSINLVRKAVIVLSYVGSAFALLLSASGNVTLAVCGLFACGVFFGMNGPSLWSITQTISGPRAAGKWTALQNCIANFAGIVAPVVTGFIVDRTGSFTGAFVVASVISLIGAVSWGFIVPRVAPIDWAPFERMPQDAAA